MNPLNLTRRAMPSKSTFPLLLCPLCREFSRVCLCGREWMNKWKNSSGYMHVDYYAVSYMCSWSMMTSCERVENEKVFTLSATEKKLWKKLLLNFRHLMKIFSHSKPWNSSGSKWKKICFHPQNFLLLSYLNLTKLFIHFQNFLWMVIDCLKTTTQEDSFFIIILNNNLSPNARKSS